MLFFMKINFLLNCEIVGVLIVYMFQVHIGSLSQMTTSKNLVFMLNLENKLASMENDFGWSIEREVINNEMDSILANKIWKLVDLPCWCKMMGCKWILKEKLNPSGSYDNYKVRCFNKEVI